MIRISDQLTLHDWEIRCSISHQSGAMMIREDDTASVDLKRFLSNMIRYSSCTLDELQSKTGIHRSRLGRIRLEKGGVSFEEAAVILRALGRPARADLLLISLGIHHSLTYEGIAFIEEFLADLPIFADRLAALGSCLNPRWARGSILLLADAIEKNTVRLRAADVFSPSGSETSDN